MQATGAIAVGVRGTRNSRGSDPSPGPSPRRGGERVFLRGLEGRAFLQLGHDTTQNTFKILSYIFTLSGCIFCPITPPFLLLQTPTPSLPAPFSPFPLRKGGRGDRSLSPLAVRTVGVLRNSRGSDPSPGPSPRRGGERVFLRGLEGRAFLQLGHDTTQNTFKILSYIFTLSRSTFCKLPVASCAFLPLSSQERGPGG